MVIWLLCISLGSLGFLLLSRREHRRSLTFALTELADVKVKLERQQELNIVLQQQNAGMVDQLHIHAEEYRRENRIRAAIAGAVSRSTGVVGFSGSTYRDEASMLQEQLRYNELIRQQQVQLSYQFVPVPAQPSLTRHLLPRHYFSAFQDKAKSPDKKEVAPEEGEKKTVFDHLKEE